MQRGWTQGKARPAAIAAPQASASAPAWWRWSWRNLCQGRRCAGRSVPNAGGKCAIIGRSWVGPLPEDTSCGADTHTLLAFKLRFRTLYQCSTLIQPVIKFMRTDDIQLGSSAFVGLLKFCSTQLCLHALPGSVKFHWLFCDHCHWKFSEIPVETCEISLVVGSKFLFSVKFYWL